MSWMTQAWKVFEAMPRAVDYRDLSDRTGMSEAEAQKCICRLLKARCIVFVGGSARIGRRYMRIEGKEPPGDQRGKSEKAMQALAKARDIRHASRPVSQFTAAKPK